MRYTMLIAVDLGAKKTGVWTSLYPDNDRGDPAGQAKGYVIQVDKNAMTFMMLERAAMRHTRRGYKRRELAKKLVCLWLEDCWPTPSSDEDRSQILTCQRYVMGLLNRRGFTHFSLEEKLNPEVVDEHGEALEILGIELGGLSPSEWITANAVSPADAAAALGSPVFKRSGHKDRNRKRSDLEEFVEAKLGSERYSRAKLKAVITAVVHLRMCLQFVKQAEQHGHKARAKYFETIRRDLEESDIGQCTCKLLGIKADDLANLIGHIGNLNSRALRAYFHDPRKLTRQSLDPERFHKAWKVFFDRWSLVGESGKREREKRSNLRNWRRRLGSDSKKWTKDHLWKLLTQYDPVETIPPFEAQSNRHPPVCQSLLLDPAALDRAYPSVVSNSLPEWRIWAQRFELAEPALNEGIDDIAERDVRVVSRHISDHERPEQKEQWRAVRLLQRVMDRSRKLDPWKLDLLTSKSRGSSYDSARQKLESKLGGQHVERFIEFAKEYRRLARQARAGAWFDSGGKQRPLLLRRCGAHPPQKSKMLRQIAGSILCDKLDGKTYESIRNLIESDKVAPPSEVAGTRAPPRKVAVLLREFSDLQKKFGGDLRVLYEEASTSKESRSAKENCACEAYQWAKAIALRIGEELGHNKDQRARYENPYSLAQLHQIFFENRGGFASNCRACLLENSWRAQLDENGTANAQRLPADSMRPFDGMLARMLRALAGRIADAVVNDISLRNDATELHIPLLLEENSFEFREELGKLKGVSKEKQKALDQLAEQHAADMNQRWKGKRQRIEAAGKGQCPYCDAPLVGGEFDHIVSRAQTGDTFGYAFNAEPNLIYVHKACNGRKGRQLYDIGNLSQRYLGAVFGTTDLTAIKSQIAQACYRLRSRDHCAFHQLSECEQRAVRHALFMQEWRDEILRKLAYQNKTRVNGTQRWLARELAQALEKALERKGIKLPVSFSVHRVPYADVGELRQRLAAKEPDDFKKTDSQPPYSHVVDAALVFAVASTSSAIRKDLGLPINDGAEVTEFMRSERALDLLPDSFRIVRVERRPKYAEGVKPWHQPLFKANPLGERFVPIGVDKDQRVWVGFSANNRFELCNPKKDGGGQFDRRVEILEFLWPVLQTPSSMNKPDLSELADLAKKRDSGILWLKVNKRKAFGLMHAVKSDPDDTFKALKSLSYQVQRADLAKILNIDDGSKQAPTRDTLLKDKDFTINVRFPGLARGKVILPSHADWRRLCDDASLKPHLGRSKIVRKRGDTQVERDGVAVIDWDAFVARHFSPGKTDRIHRRKRQVWSLPRKASSSGGFRVRRRDPDGNPVFQLLQVDGVAYKGFVANNSTAGFDERTPQLLDVLEQSKGLTPLDPKPPKQSVVAFDYPTDLSSNDLAKLGIDRLELIPATEPRRRVRMRITWEKLSEFIPTWEDPGSFRKANDSIKITKCAAQHIAEKLRSKTGIPSLGPRESDNKANIRVEQADKEKVTLSWMGGTGECKLARSNSGPYSKEKVG